MTLEERYAANYERLAADDLASPILPRYFALAQARKLVRYCGDVRGKRVLDVGAGRGDFLSLIPQADRIGVDISSVYVEYLRKQGITAFQANAEELPFNADCEIVTMTDVLEHVLNPLAAVRSAWLALKPGGRLVARVPFKEDIEVYETSKYEFAHLRSFDVRTLRHLLLPLFSVKGIHYDGFVPYRVRGPWVTWYKNFGPWQRSSPRNALCWRCHALSTLPYTYISRYQDPIARLPGWLGRLLCHPTTVTMVGVKR